MRWPWRPRPGFVRIKEKTLVELQRRALRARDLEIEIRAQRRQNATLKAQAALARLSTTEREAVAYLVASPPLTSDGRLHEPAFRAAVEAGVWAQRELELASWTPGPPRR
jgi:hypothetical protein